MKEISVSCVQFDFIKDFFCDGAFCNSRCCSGWQVDVDEQHRHKLLAIEDEELKTRISKNIEYNSEKKKHIITMQPNGVCPFVDEDCLCRIQKYGGEEKLPDICVTFPRVYYRFSDFVWLEMSLACPKVAKMALLSPGPLCLEEVNSLIKRPRMIIEIDDNGDACSEVLDLECTIISILQNCRYVLADRLLLLGYFMELIDDYYSRKNDKKLDDLISEFTNDEIQMSIIAELKKNHLEPLRFTKDICDILETVFSNPTYSVDDEAGKYIDIFKECFEINEYSNIGSFKKNYDIILETHKEMMINRYPYLEENFLVYIAFDFFSPITGNKKEFKKRYMIYVVCYRIFQVGLMALMRKYGESVCEQEMLDYISDYYKKLNHGNIYCDVIEKYISVNEMNVFKFMQIWLAQL